MNNQEEKPSTASGPKHSADTPPPMEPTPAKEKGFLSSLRSVLTYRSFSVYLVTSWILGVFGIILDSFMILYLQEILIDFILLGIMLSMFIGVNLLTRFIGGYVGDNFNRKWLSVATMAVSGIGFFFLAFTPPVSAIVVPILGPISFPFLWFSMGILIIASSSIFASGSTSYIYENISPQHSGLAMGIFQTSVGFGLVGLALLTWLFNLGYSFVSAIQIIFFVGGICYLVAALVRTIFLAPAIPIPRERKTASSFKDFFQQNWHAIKLLLVLLPVFTGVLIIDAISDGLYGFVNMFYLRDWLGFSYGDLTLMILVVLAASIPLSITVGGFFDRRGSRRAMTVIYAVMPICITLLIITPLFPYWLPIDIVNILVSISPLFNPLTRTPFIAIAFKRINDILWRTLILTYLRKAIPRSETAKMLSIFFIVIMLANLITPIPAAIAYTLFGAIPVLFITLGLNFVIMAILLLGNIEPKPFPEQS